MKAKGSVTNGQLEKEGKKLSKLQDILGVRIKNPFGVTTAEDLDAKMSDMMLVDLQRLAISAGIPGGGDRSILKRKIKTEFEKFMRGGHGQSISVTNNANLRNQANVLAM